MGRVHSGAGPVGWLCQAAPPLPLPSWAEPPGFSFLWGNSPLGRWRDDTYLGGCAHM